MNDDRAVRGFRPSTRRRNRIALGVALGAIAVGGNLAVYTALDDVEPVVQAVTDIPAGSRITPDMVRTVDADVDPTVQVIGGDDLDLVTGQYAKVRIVSGSLLTSPSLQDDPLVTTGRAVVAITADAGTLPAGLRERSRIQLVVPPAPSVTADAPAILVEGRTVGLPVATESALGTETLSVEIDEADAATIAAADDVRVVLLEPRPDPAAEEG